MKKTLGLMSAVLMAVSLASCSDSSGDYCDTLKDSQTQFADLNFSTLSDDEFNDLRDRVGTLEDQAPSDVSDDWGTLGDKLDGFKTLLDDAGIGLGDIESLQQGNLPKGADLAKLQELAPKLQEFVTDPSLTEAQQAIKENAKSECDITLG
jgi:hypothetical protein